MQWLDPESARALVFAARRLGDAPVRFLLASRPRGAAAFLRAFAQLERVDLKPLDLTALRRVIAERIDTPLPRRLLLRVDDRARGNPLHALELARALAERGLPEIGEELPEVLDDVMGDRVDRLDPASAGSCSPSRSARRAQRRPARRRSRGDRGRRA